jgi:hypothetical protein
MERVSKGFGVGGGLVNTTIHTQQAFHAFSVHLSSVHMHSTGDALMTLANMDEATFLLLAFYLLVLISIWIPILLLLFDPFGHFVSHPAISLGLAGSILLSLLDIHYAVEISAHYFPNAASFPQVWGAIGKMEPLAKIGLAALIGATWTPLFRWLARRPPADVAQPSTT